MLTCPSVLRGWFISLCFIDWNVIQMFRDVHLTWWICHFFLKKLLLRALPLVLSWHIDPSHYPPRHVGVDNIICSHGRSGSLSWCLNFGLLDCILSIGYQPLMWLALIFLSRLKSCVIMAMSMLPHFLCQGHYYLLESHQIGFDFSHTLVMV